MILKKIKLILGITFVVALYVLSGFSAPSPEAEKGNYVIAKEEEKS
ncbi:hypothetical protein [Paenibacillus pabuli]|nr:hypothetical protein [Paenibacillus pabuli]UPK41148.1 hypothetical protein KET34_17655 [Paenibacillus pabuli]